MNKIKKLFIPCKENNYHPLLIRPKFLSIYLLFILIFNLIFLNYSIVNTRAAVDFTSLYRLHNQMRQENGLKALSINSLLINSAKAKAEAMLSANCWSHYCPDGKSPWDFFDDSGYIYLYAGENLAEGFENNEGVMNAWMNSLTHKENILNEQFNEIGIGFAYGNYQGISNNTVIVVHFGTRYNESQDSTLANNSVKGISSDIVIEKPANGSILNISDFEIFGKAKSVKNVEIVSDGQVIGDVDAIGENFTFRSPESFKIEKEYLLQAEGVDDNGDLVSSNIINFQIDFTPPALEINKISYSNGLLIIKDLDASKVEIVNLSKSFENIGKNTWQIKLSETELVNIEIVSILASDKAGNTKSLDIPTSSLSSLISSENIFDISKIDIQANPRLQVNLTFSVFLSFLFGLDFYVLNKTGNTGRVNKSSALNFAIFFIVLILSLLSNLDGNILNGINT